MTIAPAKLLTFRIAGQLCGLDIPAVLEVGRGLPRLTPAPLAKPEVMGLAYMQNRIAAVVSLRRYFGFPVLMTTGKPCYILVENKGELYALLVDQVGEVGSFAPAPDAMTARLGSGWHGAITGVYLAKEELLGALDLQSIFKGLGIVKESA